MVSGNPTSTNILQVDWLSTDTPVLGRHTNVVEFFANHEIDAPVFAQDILAISYDIDPPIIESRPTENDAQFPDVNEVVEEYEVFYHAFMEKEGIESNKSEDDDAS